LFDPKERSTETGSERESKARSKIEAQLCVSRSEAEKEEVIFFSFFSPFILMFVWYSF
jgi:hypothetical protein